MQTMIYCERFITSVKKEENFSFGCLSYIKKGEKVMFELDLSNPLTQFLLLILGIVALVTCVWGIIWVIKDWNNVPEIYKTKVIPYVDECETRVKKKKG